MAIYKNFKSLINMHCSIYTPYIHFYKCSLRFRLLSPRPRIWTMFLDSRSWTATHHRSWTVIGPLNREHVYSLINLIYQSYYERAQWSYNSRLELMYSLCLSMYLWTINCIKYSSTLTVHIWIIIHKRLMKEYWLCWMSKSLLISVCSYVYEWANILMLLIEWLLMLQCLFAYKKISLLTSLNSLKKELSVNPFPFQLSCALLSVFFICSTYDKLYNQSIICTFVFLFFKQLGKKFNLLNYQSF